MYPYVTFCIQNFKALQLYLIATFTPSQEEGKIEENKSIFNTWRNLVNIRMWDNDGGGQFHTKFH